MSTAMMERVADIVMLRPSDLEIWPGLNPRKRFPEERIQELAASIAENGVLQNLVVDDSLGEGRLRLVCGETRLRAARLAEAGCPEIGLEGVEILIPCRVRAFTEAQALKLALLENLQRENLTAIEEAEGFRHLLSLHPDWTQARFAEEILGDAKRQPHVNQRLRLLELPQAVQDLVQDGHLLASHARELLQFLRLSDEQPGIAFSRFVALVQLAIDGGTRIDGPWVESQALQVRTAVEREFGTYDPFADPDEEPAPAPVLAAPVAQVTEAPEVEPEPIVEESKAPAPPSEPTTSKPAAKATNKPASPAKPAPAAPAPEPAPVAEPLAVLPAPDAARQELPEGAGLIHAILTITGRRPGILSYTPLPNGNVAVTVAPRILKAGETPFALTAAAEELDALLVPAIDTHFSI